MGPTRLLKFFVVKRRHWLKEDMDRLGERVREEISKGGLFILYDDPHTATEESGRFYKICSEGRLHRKSSGGSYVELTNRGACKGLQIAPAKPTKRIE